MKTEKKALELRYDWSAILDLEEKHDIDFFTFIENPFQAGLGGFLKLILVGRQAVDPKETEASLRATLREDKEAFSTSLKDIFDQVLAALPSKGDEEEGE